MLEALLISGVVVFWLAAVLAVTWFSLEWFDGLGAFVGLALAGLIFVTPIIYLSRAADAEGPCVQYETQMHYNAATKTMMPARVCVLRGEWIEEGE